MKRRIYSYMIGTFLCALVFVFVLAMKTNAQVLLRDNPYITLSPDGKAFTTNADETNTEWYEKGYTVSFKESINLREIVKGEHYYDYIRIDQVPVGKWTVEHAPARCIHSRQFQINSYHGVAFRKEICWEAYYSGWMAYCADCGQRVVDCYFYMSEETARNLSNLDMSMAYYYRCPHCTHLEQGVELKQHICKGISANQYSVRYHANFGKGYMPKSVHMYDNAKWYEGRAVTPQKTLTLNGYTRKGYEFTGWNTKLDGSGVHYEDGAEILNLSEEEQGSVILYAQWKKSQSVLEIDPNGGSYTGKKGIVEIIGDYGDSYDLTEEQLIPPQGANVSFETNGGTSVASICLQKEFVSWSFTQPMHGRLENDTYIFSGENGARDHVQAIYRQPEYILPECKKTGYSFGGWYYDKELTRLAGMDGDRIRTDKDITLYAGWVDLQLRSEDNYSANGGKGAVNLFWSQNDNQYKSYLVSQKKTDGNWERIYSTDDVAGEKQIKQEFTYQGKESSYTVPFSGYYKISVFGAQGENFDHLSGGKGGSVTGTVYLQKGEKITYYVGSQSGDNGGGKGMPYGNGGGYSYVATSKDGVILVAGGGGGASSVNDGMPGGMQTGLVTSMQGASGMAGGGGGWQGGIAGNVVSHIHDTVCVHQHIGSADKYGGCYTEKVDCGSKNFDDSIYSTVFYYGNIADDGSHILCPRCASHECPGHLDEYHKYRCKVCGKEYYNSGPEVCTNSKYGLGCLSKDGYVCGYEEGEVIQSSPAYGGSNYIKKESCINYESFSNVRDGNGSILIEAITVGFLEERSLKGVKAEDDESPQKVSIETVTLKSVDENKVHVVFKRPEDQGTEYYHMVESYDPMTGQKISTSNITRNVLVSGVCGYYYLVDESTDTVVSKNDTYYKEDGADPYIGVILKEALQYLHVAAVDKAGNLSETTHIPLSLQSVVYWPLVTEKMEMLESENVWKNGEVYYVRANGTSPFGIQYKGRLCGSARVDYQINRMMLDVQNQTTEQETGTLTLMFPMEEKITPGLVTYQEDSIQKYFEKDLSIADGSYMEVKRTEYCKTVGVVQYFSMPDTLDGCLIRLTPGAAISNGKVELRSQQDQDMENSLYLIGDGRGPEISGMEQLQDALKEEDWSYKLQVNATDIGSGVDSFSLIIRNLDNGGYAEIFDDDGDGWIELEMNSEDGFFVGEFQILATAKDRVGNISSKSYGLNGIGLIAYIEKIRNTQADTFRRGESGKLYIQATGYVDRVEIHFPEEWNRFGVNKDCQYVYSVPEMIRKEMLEFAVPLHVQNGTYQIEVQAFKGEKMISADPQLLTITVSGSVLDELRTRLR